MYDGDQVTVKIPYSEEANKELEQYLLSKKFYLNLGFNNVRVSGNEAVQAIYNLTLVLDANKKQLTENVE